MTDTYGTKIADLLILRKSIDRSTYKITGNISDLPIMNCELSLLKAIHNITGIGSVDFASMYQPSEENIRTIIMNLYPTLLKDGDDERVGRPYLITRCVYLILGHDATIELNYDLGRLLPDFHERDWQFVDCQRRYLGHSFVSSMSENYRNLLLASVNHLIRNFKSETIHETCEVTAASPRSMYINTAGYGESMVRWLSANVNARNQVTDSPTRGFRTGSPNFQYNDTDIISVAKAWAILNPMNNIKEDKNMFEINKVYYNDPVTVVLWKDGTKTVVKASREAYDPEKGLAMAIAKKALGNSNSYYKTFQDHAPNRKWKIEYKIIDYAHNHLVATGSKVVEAGSRRTAREALAKFINNRFANGEFDNYRLKIVRIHSVE